MATALYDYVWYRRRSGSRTSDHGLTACHHKQGDRASDFVFVNGATRRSQGAEDTRLWLEDQEAAAKLLEGTRQALAVHRSAHRCMRE